MTTKRKRKYAQDFSGKSLTDQSFTAACDVNNIIRHYENTGVDQYAYRKAAAHYGSVPNLTFSEAMQNKAELDSYMVENPNWAQRASQPPESTISEDSPLPSAERSEATGASGAAKLAPQGASDGDS